VGNKEDNEGFVFKARQRFFVPTFLPDEGSYPLLLIDKLVSLNGGE